ncbi:MAG: helix-turn-helix domain-containing protein [Thermofilum sp.]
MYPELSVVLDVLHALASPIRVNVLKALSRGGKKLSAIAQEVGASPEQLAYHLKQLREAGLVTQADDLYLLSPRGHKALRLILELEIDFLAEENELLVVNSLGTLKPLKVYLDQLAAESCPLKEPGARSKRVKVVAKTLEDLSQHGTLIPAQLAAIVLSANALKEGCSPAGERALKHASGMELEASAGAIQLLSECGLLDFASLRLVNLFTSPDSGVLATYVPSLGSSFLREIVGSSLPLREVVVRVTEDSSREMLEALLALSRYLFVSLILDTEAFPEISREEGFRTQTLRSLLLAVRLRSSADLEGDGAQYIARALNGGTAVLFSFQDLIPSSQMLTWSIKEDVQVHLGACTVSIYQVVRRAERLGKNPLELLEKVISKVGGLFLRLKKIASASLAYLAESLPEKPIFRAQVSLVDVEEGFLGRGLPAGASKPDVYAYQLAEWARELVELSNKKIKQVVDELSVDITFYAPPEAVNPEFFGVGDRTLDPLSPFRGGRRFEELLSLESLASLRIGSTLSVLEVKADSISAVQLRRMAELLENSGVKLFTVTATGLKYCRTCGNIFGKAALRCPRCQSVRVEPLVRRALLYVPESTVV